MTAKTFIAKRRQEFPPRRRTARPVTAVGFHPIARHGESSGANQAGRLQTEADRQRLLAMGAPGQNSDAMPFGSAPRSPRDLDDSLA